MIYVHSGDKLFPEIQYRAYIHFLHDTEPSCFDILYSDIEAIENCKNKFIRLGEQLVNLDLAKQIWFETYIWGQTEQTYHNGDPIFNWIYLSPNLLKTILSDEGQAILLKRSMNVPT